MILDGIHIRLSMHKFCLLLWNLSIVFRELYTIRGYSVGCFQYLANENCLARRREILSYLFILQTTSILYMYVANILNRVLMQIL